MIRRTILSLALVTLVVSSAVAQEAPAAAQASAVSDALKLRTEQFRNKVLKLQNLELQIQAERAKLAPEGNTLLDELRKALKAKPDDDIDLDTFTVKAKASPPAAAK